MCKNSIKLKRNVITGYLFIAPAVVAFTLFLVYPAFEAIRLSFYHITLKSSIFVGFENFQKLLKDRNFHIALTNTFKYVLFIVPLTMAFSIFISVLIFNKKERITSFYRGVFYIPTIASAVTVSLVWNWIYNPVIGVANYVLSILGIPPQEWLSKADTAFGAVVLVILTTSVGQPVILYTAALGGISNANYSGRGRSGLTPIEGDNDKASIYASRISPDGKIVGEERILAPVPEGALNVMSPALRWLPDNRLGMLYSCRKSKKEACRLFVASEDEGLTWSKPVVVAEGNYVTGCHDRFTVLSGGRLIAPLHCTDDWDWHYLHVKVAWSDDCGKTWTTSNKVELPFVGSKYGWKGGFIESGCVEPSVAERDDGSLLMSLRTAMGTLFYSESFDKGESWTLPKSMEVVSPQAPAHLSRIPGTSDLLLIWTPNYNVQENLGGKRNTIMACISTDGGRTCPHGRRKVLVDDSGHAVDYPAVLYKNDEVWIALRYSSTANIIEGLTSTGIMRVPIGWLYE